MSSKVIKVMNVCDQKDIDKYREERFHEIEADMTEEFDKYGKLNNVMIVKPKMRKIGAEIGSVFVEFDQLNHAEFCMKNMKGRRYDGREIKCAFMDEDVYFKELQLKKEEK
jgi:hypothetical protein